MLGMAHTLLTENRYDPAFVSRYCVGFETFRCYLLGESDGIAKDAEWGAGITGISADTIRHLARSASDNNSLLTCAWSLQRAHRGEQPYWAAIALAAMLGGIGRPGGGFAFGHGSMNGVGVPRTDLPGPEFPLPPNPASKAIPVARVADMLLQPGAAYEFNGRHEIYPDIKLIYWAGGNPFHHHQDLNRLRQHGKNRRPSSCMKAVGRRQHDMPTLYCRQRQRWNATMWGAPRATRIFSPCIARIDPVGEARSDFDIFHALADRLGYAQAFTEGRNEMDWCRWIYERVSTGAARKNVTLPTSRTFGATGYVELPPPDEDFVLFEDFRRDPQLHPLKHHRDVSRSPLIPLADSATTTVLRHPTWIEPGEWLGSAGAARWPLHLITHQPADRLHSQMDLRAGIARAKVTGREQIRLNPGGRCTARHQKRRHRTGVQRTRRVLGCRDARRRGICPVSR